MAKLFIYSFNIIFVFIKNYLHKKWDPSNLKKKRYSRQLKGVNLKKPKRRNNLANMEIKFISLEMFMIYCLMKKQIMYILSTALELSKGNKQKVMHPHTLLPF